MPTPRRTTPIPHTRPAPQRDHPDPPSAMVSMPLRMRCPANRAASENLSKSRRHALMSPATDRSVCPWFTEEKGHPMTQSRIDVPAELAAMEKMAAKAAPREVRGPVRRADPAAATGSGCSAAAPGGCSPRWKERSPSGRSNGPRRWPGTRTSASSRQATDTCPAERQRTHGVHQDQPRSPAADARREARAASTRASEYEVQVTGQRLRVRGRGLPVALRRGPGHHRQPLERLPASSTSPSPARSAHDRQ